MKLPVDVKFLVTAVVMIILTVATIAFLNPILGTGPAAAGATVIGLLTIKLLDKLDYNPSLSLDLGVPKLSVAWIYSALAAVFMVSGSDVVVRIVGSILKPINSAAYPCTGWQIVPLVLLDWGGLILAGWIIGHLFPERALALSSMGAVVYILALLLELATLTPGDLEYIARCFSLSSSDPENLSDMGIGMVGGVVVRGYVVIVMARIASRGLRSDAAA